MKFNLSILSFYLCSLIVGQNTQHQEKFRLVQFSESQPPQWINERQYDDLIKSTTHFFDRTDRAVEPRSLPTIIDDFIFPTQIRYKPQTEKAIAFLDMDRGNKFLTQLSSFYTRFYNTTTGVQGAQFIHDHLKTVASHYNTDVTIEKFTHKWVQPSIIARIKGTSKPEDIVVLGAHLDSINSKNPEKGRSPGADDDGSGVTLLMEVFQSLLASDFKPTRTLEFQFFAAEEVGLKGSQAIAQDYRLKSKKVVAMLQQDMVGYKAPGVDKIAIMNDFSDPLLTTFLKKLITSYTIYPIKENVCRYACSDHASYFEAGYRSAISSEEILARGYHSEKDVIEDIDWDYFREFCKVATAFAIELAQPEAN